jgi:hypothetical protein
MASDPTGTSEEAVSGFGVCTAKAGAAPLSALTGLVWRLPGRAPPPGPHGGPPGGSKMTDPLASSGVLKPLVMT